MNRNDRARRDWRRDDDYVGAREVLSFTATVMSTIKDVLGRHSGLPASPGAPFNYAATQSAGTGNQPPRAPRAFYNGNSGYKRYNNGQDKATKAAGEFIKRRREHTRSKRAPVGNENAPPSTPTHVAWNSPQQPVQTQSQPQPFTDVTAHVNNAPSAPFYPQMVHFGAPFFPVPPFAPTLPAGLAMPQAQQSPAQMQQAVNQFSFGQHDWANDPPRGPAPTPFDLTTPVPMHPGVGHPAQHQIAGLQAELGFPTTTFTHTGSDDTAMSIVGSPLPMEQQQALADSTLALTLTDGSSSVGQDEPQPATTQHDPQPIQPSVTQDGEVKQQQDVGGQQLLSQDGSSAGGFVSSLSGALGDDN
ncbi:hypothetical protein AURDEDRAFT_121947 [Auricularia subglabra TFB-10046 SS5]|nr:hypothetical protein AURDEDRAFT_121947 [Auricularia subglabra TFB-10046 SS5]